MKRQTKKGLRLAAYAAAAAILLTLLPASALAASCPTGSVPSDILNALKNSGSSYSSSCPTTTCSPSDILNALKNSGSSSSKNCPATAGSSSGSSSCPTTSCSPAGSSSCPTASCPPAGSSSCPTTACSPSDVLNALKSSGSSSSKNCPPTACSPTDILNALKNGNGADVSSLYKYLCPSASPACSAKPSATPAATATPAPTATPATPAPTATADPSAAASALEKQMVELINAERAKAGVAALTIDAKVTQVARLKSQDMIDKGYFSHTSPTYGSPFDMLKAYGVSYRTAGENIAMNRSMESAHTALMNSSGHRQNILNASYKSIGVGIVANASGYLYITQMFIG